MQVSQTLFFYSQHITSHVRIDVGRLEVACQRNGNGKHYWCLDFYDSFSYPLFCSLFDTHKFFTPAPPGLLVIAESVGNSLPSGCQGLRQSLQRYRRRRGRRLKMKRRGGSPPPPPPRLSSSWYAELPIPAAAKPGRTANYLSHETPHAESKTGQLGGG